MTSPKNFYKKDAIRAAKDFGYGPEVIEKIQNAKSEFEISRIMAAARKEKFG